MSIHGLYARISPRFRRRRMRRFETLIAPRSGESLLDLGGTPWFWNGSAPELARSLDVTLLNAGGDVEAAASAAQLKLVRGDACALPFASDAFDIVFSNSVIEHVGTWERQRAFAAEARRVGRRLWIQTPAREFFLEPHLVAPFIHWLPQNAQQRLIRNFTVRGWIDRPSAAEVRAFLAEVRLLSFYEMQVLFPDCTILRERFLGMTKSYIAVRTTAS